MSAQSATSKRDRIREAVFASRQFKTRNAEILGQKVTIRQPSIGDLSKYASESDNNDKNQLVLMIIDHTYVPGTTEKVFEPTDYDSLLNIPSGEWMLDFQRVWSDLTGLDTEEAEKNLSETDSGS